MHQNIHLHLCSATQSPYVENGGIIPAYGPVAGGTEVLIIAGYLGNNSDISVFLGDTDIEFRVFR